MDRDYIMRLQFNDDRPQATVRLRMSARHTDIASFTRWLFTSGEREGVKGIGVFLSEGEHWPAITEGEYVVMGATPSGYHQSPDPCEQAAAFMVCRMDHCHDEEFGHHG
jgi:hypothetical protein